MRFYARRRITNTGRTRFWYVVDRERTLPDWGFGEHKDEHRNRLDAEDAARWLNAGYYGPNHDRLSEHGTYAGAARGQDSPETS